MAVTSLTVKAKEKPKMGDSSYDDKITFVKEHHLFRDSEGLTVLSLDLEWPEALNHSTSPELQKFLCSKLFDNDGTSLPEGMEKFLRSKGTELTQMPDNPDKVNHISISLYGMLWEKNKYISYKFSVAERDNLSSEDSITYGFFTYDIINDKVLTAKDIFKHNYFPGGYLHDRLVSLVLRNMSNSDEFREDDIPGEAFLMPEGVILALEDIKSEDGYLSLVPLPIYDNDLSYMLISETRKLFKSSPVARYAPGSRETDNDKATAPEPGTDPTYIYKVVDEKPDLEYEGLTIDTYLASHANYPAYEELANIVGKVVLQFVVEADGSISQISSVRPISPGLAREAVRVLRDTPKWKPATIKGIPVRSLCSVTLNFNLK